MYKTKQKKTHLSVADGQLKFGHRQLGRLAVHIGAVQQAGDKGRGRRLGDRLRRQSGAAGNRGGSRRRSVPLCHPVDGPPLAAAAAADTQVGRHLLQDCSPLVPELAGAPVVEGPNDEADSRVVDKVHRPITKLAIR